MRDVEQQDSETSGLLNKQASADEKPNALHGDNHPLRETCQSLGGGPVNGFDVYRDQNLRKASN